MRITRLTVLLLILVAAPHCFAQSKSAAQRTWLPFFKAFHRAVAKRERETLRKMLPPDFLWSSGHHRRVSEDAAFDYWDERSGRGWKAFNRILSQGTVTMARWWNNGNPPERPSRVAPAGANRRSNIDRDRITGTPSLNFELMVVGIASYLRNAAINASPLSNTRWERTRRERASLLSWVGDPLKRNRELEETCR
ncbi:MAG TPA: hypothetical protein VGQ39_10545 [Pyrinomonadaceae bacterium]|nr:hypothetical protein [Pyrinomonadaceae bacterium]